METTRRIMSSWTDKAGAITLNESLGEQDSENALLFTGEVALLCRLLGLGETYFWATIWRAVRARQIENYPGLFNRYADGTHDRSTSWDEYNGLMFIAMSFNPITPLAAEIVEYGSKHNWAYINESPGTAPSLWRPSTWKYLGRIRQPRDTCFYKICANVKPSWAEITWLAQSMKLDSCDTVEETSGNIMAWFRYKAIMLAGFEHETIENAQKFWDIRIAKQYGDKPLIEMFKIYFKNAEHPLHELAQQYYQKFIR